LSRLHTSFVLGFHGCDRNIGEQTLAGKLDLIQSDRDYDWLGPGVYFWEGDPVRAREWAEAKAKRVPGMIPYVVGAAIDLGHCLDLTSRDNVELLRDAHDGLVASLQKGNRCHRTSTLPAIRAEISGSEILIALSFATFTTASNRNCRAPERTALSKALTRCAAFSAKAILSILEAVFMSGPIPKSRYVPSNASKAFSFPGCKCPASAGTAVA
jgi:hypothetical protein